MGEEKRDSARARINAFHAKALTLAIEGERERCCKLMCRECADGNTVINYGGFFVHKFKRHRALLPCGAREIYKSIRPPEKGKEKPE